MITQGAELRVIDYDSSSSIIAALTGVDVVISTVGFAGIAKQVNAVIAAKQAGVKLFVPSDFGTDTEGEIEGLFGEKERTRLKAKEIGLPYASFFTGLFSDYLISP